MAFWIISKAFDHEGTIPSRYTCEGGGISPALEWGEVPEQTQSFALIMDDPDAPGGTWVHWVLYNLPATARNLEENVPKEEVLEDGAKQGVSSFHRVGYGGPCPPSGPAHRYFFKLYALNCKLDDLKPKMTKEGLEKAMEGHVIEKAELMGRYSRK